MELLKPEETELIGKSTDSLNYGVRDPITDRIDWLISNYLAEIAERDGGWTTLYQDPNDERYWELTYPHGEMQGGGPPSLRNISLIQVRNRYGDTTKGNT